MDPARRTLLVALERHEPADDVERAHVTSVVRLIEGQSQCFARGFFTPGHITASAFVLDEAGRLLLHHHKKLDRWLQLGGHDEGEQDPRLAALREAREESGIIDLAFSEDAIFDVDVHEIPAHKDQPRHFHHDIRYLLRAPAGAKLMRDDLESNALEFVPLEEARVRLAEASADRVIAKIRRHLAS